MNARLLPALEVDWSKEGAVVRVEGASEHVQGWVGRPLQDVLGVSHERIRELEMANTPVFLTATIGGHGTTLRCVVTPMNDGFSAVMLDMSELLKGAPPLQISSLSSSLSHEIRNPLSSVKMAVQTLARNSNLSERDHRRLAIANREIRTMERMLWLFSEYGRDQAPTLEPMGLGTLVQEAAALVELELSERRIRLNMTEPEDAPKPRVERTRLRPVLAQILLNVAAGHPEDATVDVTIRRSAAGGAELVVVDPSATLRPEERDTLFEPFGSMLARGAGLSLAALFQVMKALGGTVAAEPNAPSGTRYTLTFPL